MDRKRLTQDGTAETVSREQILSGANGDREVSIFPVQLTTSRIDYLTQLIHTLSPVQLTTSRIIGNPNRLIYTLLYVMIIHICDDHTWSTSKYKPVYILYVHLH